LTGIAAITVLAGWLLVTKLAINNSLEVFAPDSPEMDALDEYRAAFGRDDLFLILIEGDVFSPTFLANLRKAHTVIEKLQVDVPVTSHLDTDNDNKTDSRSSTTSDEFDDDFDDDFDEGSNQPAADDWDEEDGGSVFEDVISLINARQTVPVVIDGDQGIRITKLLDPMPPESDLENVKSRALANPSIVGRLLGPDARHTVIAARTFQMRDEDMERVAVALDTALEP